MTLCWRELDSNLQFLSKPEVFLPRYAQVIGIMQTYLGAREPCSAFLVQRPEPLYRAGLGHGLNRLWLAPLRGIRTPTPGLPIHFVKADQRNLRTLPVINRGFELQM